MDVNPEDKEENLALCLEVNKAISDLSIKKSLQFTGISDFQRENISPFDVPSPNLPETNEEWKRALEAQQSWFHQFMRRITDYRTEPKIHLFLNAPLPLCFALGIRLSNRYNCLAYQENQEKGIFEPMNVSSEELSSSNEPYWTIKGLSHDPVSDFTCGPVVLGISITHDVSAQTRKEIPNLGISEPIAEIYLNPKGGVGHEAIQPSEHYKVLAEFRQLLDKIVYLWPNRTGVHLFYAGPASVAFLLGQRVNMNVHYPISFYNFRQKYYRVFDTPFSNSSKNTEVFKPKTLPVIGLTLSEYKGAGKKISKEYEILMIMHLLSDFASMIFELENIGLNSEKTKIVGIPYSTRAPVVEWLLKHSYDVVVSDCRNYSDIYSQVEKVLKEQLEVCKKGDRKLLIIEDGGYAVPMLHSKFGEYSQYVVGAVEQTANGIWVDKELEEKGKLKIPVMNVAESEYKKEVESKLVGQAIVLNIRNLLAKIGKGVDKKVLLGGFGATGSMVAKELSNAGANVSVYDSDQRRLHSARESSYTVYEDPKEGIRDKELIVGCTGKVWIEEGEMSQLKHGTYFVNATSKRLEINYDHLEVLCHERVEMDKFIGYTYKIGSDRREIHLLADGFPVNFFDNESIPDEQIQFIPALMAASAIELLEQKPEPGIHKVSDELQKKVASYQLRHG
jgi:adenosylhomocysteinase